MITINFLENIQFKKNLLPKSELKACNEIMSDFSLIQRLSFSELSEKINVTKVTIVRFCQRIGYSGYSEFKYDCINYLNSKSFNPNNYYSEALENISSLYINSINLIKKTTTENEILTLINYINNSKIIKTIGTKESFLISEQLRYTFLNFGISIDIIRDKYELEISTPFFINESLIIIFSHDSREEIINKTIEISKNKNSKTVLITMNSEYKYKEHIDLFILLPSINNLKNKSIFNNIPIFSIFIEFISFYYKNDLNETS